MGKFSSNAKETSEATHVISEITYGSDSYFVFEQKVEEYQNDEQTPDLPFDVYIDYLDAITKIEFQEEQLENMSPSHPAMC